MPELTPEERRRNVARVEDVEASLAQLEQMSLMLVYQGALIMRRLHEQRQVLRDVFGKEPPPDLPPLAEAAEGLAGEVVIIEAGRRPPWT